MPRRPAHKLAHATCPYGQLNWADCDREAAHRWGRCKAEVERKGADEPGDCTRWAQDEDGYCQQHFIARHEKEMEAARRAERQLQLYAGIDAFIAMTAKYPSIFDRPGARPMSTSAESTRGLAGVQGVEPRKAVLETAPPPRLTPKRKPFKLAELA